jgi:hypothetical protein
MSCNIKKAGTYVVQQKTGNELWVRLHSGTLHLPIAPLIAGAFSEALDFETLDLMCSR